MLDNVFVSLAMLSASFIELRTESVHPAVEASPVGALSARPKPSRLSERLNFSRLNFKTTTLSCIEFFRHSRSSRNWKRAWTLHPNNALESKILRFSRASKEPAKSQQRARGKLKRLIQLIRQSMTERALSGCVKRWKLQKENGIASSVDCWNSFLLTGKTSRMPHWKRNLKNFSRYKMRFTHIKIAAVWMLFGPEEAQQRWAKKKEVEWKWTMMIAVCQHGSGGHRWTQSGEEF